ncbi:uncharacterized protein LOC111519088 [Drosophila willistoni]|uniref:uncharacterized protein LOC111519088 n=1 Tax=Drosophila willistoni TaxID=7260 RepID=UPI001F076118|nr:uncharacterized protein LOC111519088 [Drosophila willistoni]
MFRLLLCELLLLLALASTLDEREYDVKVAPISTSKVKRPLYSWPRLLAQLRRAFSTETTSTSTPLPRLRTTSTPAPTLEFYGALNPIYQTGQF